MTMTTPTPSLHIQLIDKYDKGMDTIIHVRLSIDWADAYGIVRICDLRVTEDEWFLLHAILRRGSASINMSCS